MTSDKKVIQSMFDAGVHFGYSKATRHPSVKDFVFGIKDGVQIIDLEQTQSALAEAKEFLKEVAPTGKVLFVASKNESQDIIKRNAKDLGMPYVTNRWVGGTLTNFSQIKRRIQKLERMLDEREKGEFAKYTKKEQLMLDREIEKLKKNYGGLVGVTEMPKAVVIVDSGYEEIAMKEANIMNIPVVSISSTDCDISTIEYPIVANDSTRKSVDLIISELTSAIKAN
tara:strand:+ start:885 stop:1562 length:678 start_codon:yes stop_codon:yes gene_type:complete